MNVMRSGSALRFRIAFAARPTATRSRDSSSASASSSEIRSPSRALSRTSVTLTSQPRTRAWHGYVPGDTAAQAGSLSCVTVRRALRTRAWHRCASYDDRLSNEAELGHLVELAGLLRELEEGHQAGSLTRAEAIAQLLEVPGEEASRIPVALARLVRQAFRLGPRQAHGGDEGVLQLHEPGLQGLGARPDRKPHRQARALEPQAPEVVVRRRILERGLQRRIADQELRIGLLPERHVLGLRQQHLRQHDRGRGLRRDGDLPHLLERLAGHELERIHRTLRAHAQARQKPESIPIARILDGRDLREAGLAGEQAAGWVASGVPG